MSLALLLSLAVAACSGITGPSERVVTMDVASQRVPCTGLVPRECLRVRQLPDTAWGLFYDAIDGFAFEAGFEYTLRVRVRTVPNPPADASSLAYRLITVLRKTPPV